MKKIKLCTVAILLAMCSFGFSPLFFPVWTETAADPNPDYWYTNGKQCLTIGAYMASAPTAAPLVSIYGDNVECAQKAECTAAEYAAKNWILLGSYSLSDATNWIIKTRDSGYFLYIKFDVSGNTDPATITFSRLESCEVIGYTGG